MSMATLGLKKRDNETGEVLNEGAALRELMRSCAYELEAALALKVGVMDSESKAAAINAERAGAMQAVAERLRGA
jgi:stage III sporulation protein SpoIIIAA